MTFEEFFAKKKIDLAQLRRAKPDLFGEFRRHYAEMGEKSFDHTKKYWFNRLRKDFRMANPAPLEKVFVEAPAQRNEERVAVAAKAATPTGFKPRFKLGVTQSATTPATDEHSTKEKQTPAPAKAATPSGFKPRFKPGTMPPAPSQSESASAQSPDAQSELPVSADTPATQKPLGFKPRFKPGGAKPVVPAKEPAPEEPTSKTEGEKTETTSEITPPKPLGFKPRFKPGVTNKKKDNNDD